MYVSETHLQFFHLLNRLRKMDWSSQLKPLKPAEFAALKMVSDYQKEHPEVPGIYVSELAAQTNLTLPATSKLLKHLEHQGWVRRTVDLCKRRNTFVSITEEGEALVETGSRRCAVLGNKLFSQMGAEESAALLRSVTRVVDLLEEELAKPPEPDPAENDPSNPEA